MARRIKKNTGITLSELIVSMTIVGIVMIGIVSADYAIQRFYKDSAAGALSGFDAIAMMNNISNNTIKSEGNISDKGIRIDTSITGGVDAVAEKTFCIRVSTNPVNWTCYTQLTAADTFDYLYSCSKNAPATCALTDEILGKLVKAAGAGGVSASFTLNAATGAQRCAFNFSLTVPNPDEVTTKTVNTSITPPNCRL